MTLVYWIPYCAMCCEELEDSHTAIEAHDKECPNKDD